VLEEIGASAVPKIRVFNKIDMVGSGTDQAPTLQEACEADLRARYPGCIVMSARVPGDVQLLHAAIVRFFQRDLVEAELFLPWSAQQLRGKIFADCEVLDERADNDGAFLSVRTDPVTLAALRQQLGEVPVG
jgi:GTP-binding protein HflX